MFKLKFNYKIDFDELETNGKASKQAYWVKR